MKALPLVCLLLAGLLNGCEGSPPAGQSPVAAKTSDDAASLVFTGFKARGSLKGIKQWEAVAKSARVFHASQKASAEEVEITYFQNGRAVSRARARHADINLKSYDLDAEGEVRVRASNGVVVMTEHLSWDNAREEVRTKDAVRVVRGKTILTGRGLVADRKLEKLEVQQDVNIEAASVEELRKLQKEIR